jgi:hypothetical protein
MAELTTAPASGDQGTTQNPQTVPSGQSVSGASTQSGGVQPGTAQAVLTSQDGLSLRASALTTVNLNTTASTESQTRPVSETQQSDHHINPALFAISITLVLIAIGLFWFINHSAKSTTN